MRDAVELILSQGSDDDECKDDSLYVQSKLNSAYEEMSTFDECVVPLDGDQCVVWG